MARPCAARRAAAAQHPPGDPRAGKPLWNVHLETWTTAAITAGLNVRTGRQVFSFPDGAFNPVISDFGAIYLAGYTQLYQILPRRHVAHSTRHHTTKQAKAYLEALIKGDPDAIEVVKASARQMWAKVRA